jgi:hypothetical protein
MEHNHNPTCPSPCFPLCCWCGEDDGSVFDSVWDWDINITVDTMWELLGRRSLAPEKSNIKVGNINYLTFPLWSLLSIAVCVGKMKVVFPDYIWGLRY